MEGFLGRTGPKPLVAVVILAASLLAGCGGENAEASNPADSTQVAGGPTMTRSTPPTSAAEPSQTPQPTTPGEQTYEVQAGDTLGDIAERFYDDRAEWQPIYDANKDVIGDNPDAITVGMTLKIPPKP